MISQHMNSKNLPIRDRSDSTMSSVDDFDIVDDFKMGETGQNTESVSSLKLEIHPLREEDSVLISIHPPHQPETKVTHVPCDIVLVIDVSGSMASEAPLPDAQDQAKKESSGLSILDLTKHAARTVLESLNDGDRLGLVTFSYDAKIIQPLTVMSDAAKKETAERIAGLADEGATNLWAGIQTGLDLFADSRNIGNVQGLYILTDGMPNHMCPRRGYIPTLGPILKELALSTYCVPSIHTFGFGYTIQSHLLQSIAELGDGNYAFIPDAGMIGTVFVHAVANLQSTHASAATLEIRTSNPSATLLSNSGTPVDASELNRLVLRVGNILYGQSRDIVIPYQGLDRDDTITTVLKYKLPDCTYPTIRNTVALSAKTSLSSSMTTYHLYRNRLCAFLASLFPAKEDGIRLKSKLPTNETRDQMMQLANSILKTLSSQPENVDLLSLAQDLIGTASNPESESQSPSGQIQQALTQTPSTPYYTKWGSHYLPSLLHAHMRQTCNSFKDHGPLRYGLQSPLFIQCRDTLDALFEKLPPPKPSVAVRNGRTSVPVNMHRYHNSSGPCFLGSCQVTLSDGKRIEIKDLRVGMQVWNPLVKSGASVAAVIETRTTSSSRGKNNTICRVPNSNLWITPYHPIFYESVGWIFPHEVAESSRELEVDECIYSILLQPSDDDLYKADPDFHAFKIGGVTCTTLGHGLTSQSQNNVLQGERRDVRPHPFFGDHEAVRCDIFGLRVDEKGHHVSGGVARDEMTGLVCGFMRAGPVEDVLAFEGSIRENVKMETGRNEAWEEGRWMRRETLTAF